MTEFKVGDLVEFQLDSNPKKDLVKGQISKIVKYPFGTPAMKEIHYFIMIKLLSNPSVEYMRSPNTIIFAKS